ncbi:MAG: proline dehydrogenase family protein [Nitriliruptoraceae bacterium]
MVSRILVRASESERLQRLAMGDGIAGQLTGRITHRFIAGEELSEAIEVARELNLTGRTVTLDLVGEKVRDEADADVAAIDYRGAIGALAEQGVRSGVSIKPSQLGAALDLGRTRERLSELAAAAGQAGLHLTLDMEDHTTVERTIELVEALHAEGHTHVGCAVQTALHRTPEDIARLNELGASLRLCKGAYAEPVSVAHQDRAAIDEAYAVAARELLAHGTYPRFATHDHRLIGTIRRDARELGRGRESYEFQMLYGIRTDVQQRLIDIGERLCVYVPFGQAWYPYFVRRLAERPANLLFFARALLP